MISYLVLWWWTIGYFYIENGMQAHAYCIQLFARESIPAQVNRVIAICIVHAETVKCNVAKGKL